MYAVSFVQEKRPPPPKKKVVHGAYFCLSSRESNFIETAAFTI